MIQALANKVQQVFSRSPAVPCDSAVVALVGGTGLAMNNAAPLGACLLPTTKSNCKDFGSCSHQKVNECRRSCVIVKHHFVSLASFISNVLASRRSVVGLSSPEVVDIITSPKDIVHLSA